VAIDNKKPIVEERKEVEPSPKDLQFFEWLEKLFYVDAQSPEKIDVRVVSGKHHERLGPSLIRRDYGPSKESKPSKTKLVTLSNEILFAVQRDCDIQRKSLVYAVSAWDFTRGDDPYERWLLRRQPGTMFQGEGGARGGGGGGDDADETAEQKLIAQMMRHHETMFGLYGGGFEGLLDRMDRILERQDSRIKEQDDRIAKQNEMMERALSMEEERAEKRAWAQLKAKGAEKMLDMAVAIAPPLLNQLVGKTVVETKETAESITLKEFFKTADKGGKLTQEQSNKAFGRYSDKEPYDLIEPGVLTLGQAKLLFDVAHCNIPSDELDKLMPDGPLAISMEQIMKLQTSCGLAPEQIMPIGALFEARYSAWKKKHGMQ
jgi:hypothetical protein